MEAKGPSPPSIMTPSLTALPAGEMGPQPFPLGEVNGFTHSQKTQNTPRPRTSGARIPTGQNPHRLTKTREWGHMHRSEKICKSINQAPTSCRAP